MERYDIALLGGDARTAYMMPYLVQEGYSVIYYGLSEYCGMGNHTRRAGTFQEAVESARILVGGIPVVKDHMLFSSQLLPDMQIEDFYTLIKKGQSVFGGVLSDEMIKICEEKEIRYYDFMKSEPLAIKNAIATAEGSILEALLHRATNLHGSSVLVLGYGRCGKVLAHKLKGLDARVSICSRCDRELAYADTQGMIPVYLKDFGRNLESFEYIFNTIPAQVLTKDKLKKVRKDGLIIDIASAPGGVDDEMAKKLGITVLHCYGLPGKYAPKAAAKDLTDYVIQKIEE